MYLFTIRLFIFRVQAISKKIRIAVEQMTSDEIYALLDMVESGNEDDIDNLLNDSDTEFEATENLRCMLSFIHLKKSGLGIKNGIYSFFDQMMTIL